MDVCSLLSLICFGLSCCFVVLPCSIPIPCIVVNDKTVKILLDYRSSGMISICILLLMGCIDIQQIYDGIVGTETLQPYSILLLFLSLAYMSISLDQTGIFSFIAYFFVRRIGNSGKHFYLFIFLLSSILTIFTSNDIVIMTLTPVICYIASQSKANVTSYLIIQFFSANIWSAALYIGNPTNVIVAESVGLNFIQYSEWTLFPTIIAGITMVLFTACFTYHIIPKEMNIDYNTLHGNDLQKYQAFFGSVIMFSSIICIIIVTFIPHIPIFLAALPFACIVFIKDVFFDVKNYYLHTYQDLVDNSIELHDVNEELVNNPSSYIKYSWKTKESIDKMPWNIIPFALGMFILVESLDKNGWISNFAELLTFIIGDSIMMTIFLIGILSTLFCNIMNNQPMTILFVRIILNENFLPHNPSLINPSLFAIALGSNFGANFTLIGALAGILWSDILKQHNQHISYFTFALYGIRIMPIVLLSSLFILYLEYIIV